MNIQPNSVSLQPPKNNFDFELKLITKRLSTKTSASRKNNWTSLEKCHFCMCLLERFCPDWHNVAEQFSKVKNDILKYYFFYRYITHNFNYKTEQKASCMLLVLSSICTHWFNQELQIWAEDFESLRWPLTKLVKTSINSTRCQDKTTTWLTTECRQIHNTKHSVINSIIKNRSHRAHIMYVFKGV